jgi:hypothetical protein
VGSIFIAVTDSVYYKIGMKSLRIGVALARRGAGRKIDD